MALTDNQIRQQSILEGEARSKAYLARLQQATTQAMRGGVENLFTTGLDPQLKELIDSLRTTGTGPNAERQAEITNVRGQRAEYSKGAAFADAQGLINQQQRKALEELLPAINNSARGAGASQSSMRALLLNEAATQAAEASSAAGLKAAVDYGQISAGLSGVLEGLTRTDDTQAKLLLQALDLARTTRQSQNINPIFDIGGGGITRGSDLGNPWDGARESDLNFDIRELQFNSARNQLLGYGANAGSTGSGRPNVPNFAPNKAGDSEAYAQQYLNVVNSRNTGSVASMPGSYEQDYTGLRVR